MGHARTRWVAGVSTLGAMILIVLIAPTTFARVPSTQTGVIGAYSLNDSPSNPGVTCKFKTDYNKNGAWAGHLNRLVVNAPNVFAAAGSQKVGWGFEVERRRGRGAWVTTYASPIWKATATTASKASFTNESVSVGVPSDAITHVYSYRVLYDMFWYAQNGTTVTGTATQNDRNYTHFYGTFVWSQGPKLCQAEEQVAP